MSTAAQWAAVFDWDGVIIDSSSQHERSWELLAEEEGYGLPPDHFTRSFGMTSREVIPKILEWTEDANEITRLDQRKEVLYRELIVADGISPLPGVVLFLEALKTAGIPAVIATSTARVNVECTIDVMGLREHFTDMVSAEDVTHGKPHPEVFLKAALKAQATPDRAIVFEDAHVGIAAGHAAGMKVVALATTHARETLEEADRIVDRLDELDPGELGAWLGA